MSWLFEDPTTVVVAGLFIEAILAFVIFKTGRLALLAAAGGVLALMLAVLLVERLVVTETEQVEDTFIRAAAALEANDVNALFDLVASSAQPMKNQAQQQMSLVEITSARFRDLSVDVRPGHPPTATARFQGTIQGNDRTGQVPYRTYARRFVVELVYEDDRWLMTDYRTEDLLGQPGAEEPFPR